MAPPAKRAFLPVALVAVLSIVLVLLAVLQYRWSLEISRAERTRIQSSLNASVTQFRQEFYRELTQISTAFHGDLAAEPADFWSSYAERYQTWSRTSTRPDLVANVFVWQAGSGAGARLLQLRPADGQFETVTWPPSLAGLRDRLESEAHQHPAPGPGAMPDLRAFTWTFEQRIPALLRPIFHFSDSPWRRGDGPPARQLLGFAIVELNAGALDRMLGELAQRYFSGPDGFVYNVEVLGAPPESKVIYRSDPALTPESVDPPDARVPLVPVSPAQNRALENAPPANPALAEEAPVTAPAADRSLPVPASH